MGLARSQHCLFVKVRTCPLFAHSQMLLGLATSSADIVANGRYRRMARFRQFPRPWGRMNAGRRQTPHTQSARLRAAHLSSACARLRFLVAARGQTGQAPMKGSRSREKVIMEVVTPIAVRNNSFGLLLRGAGGLGTPR